MNVFKKDTEYFITVYRANDSLVSDKYGEFNYIIIKNIRREGMVYIGKDRDNNERRFSAKFNIDYSEV